MTKQAVKQQFAAWEESIRSRQDVNYFKGWKDMPETQFGDAGFDLAEAWWMAELCRLVYTPDSKEFPRLWHVNKPDRNEILEEKTPFRELLDVHKTGNHASIYEIGRDGGTVLCFRGTSKLVQWISNLVFHPHEWARFREPGHPEDGFLHSGFYVIFKRIWPLLWPTLRLAKRPWIFAGHSLGGALALIAHAVVGADKIFTFGTPRIGNSAFADLASSQVFRIVNQQDLVPHLPSKNKKLAEKEFVHGGSFVWISESGVLTREEEKHPASQPWDLIEEWAREPRSLTELPPWIRQHFIGEYCDELRLILEDTDAR